MKRCGPTCWTADTNNCSCICQGKMHGRGGRTNRALVIAVIGKIPRTLDQWREAAPRMHSAMTSPPVVTGPYRLTARGRRLLET